MAILTKQFKMKNSNIKIQKDSTITLTNKEAIQQVFVETVPVKENNFNICDCKIISDLIWPITILIIISAFYKRINQLLDVVVNRVRKIKFGNIELELEKLNTLAEITEEKIDKENLNLLSENKVKVEYNYDSKQIKDLPTEILKISIEMERLLRTLYENNEPTKRAPLPVSILIENLRVNKIIDFELTKLLREFWIFRNGIVHAVSYSLTEKELLAIVDIGFRILKILNSLENNKTH